MELADKKVLVTGANGFIGSHVVTRLAGSEGARVIALVRKKSAQPAQNELNPAIQVAHADITDEDALLRAASGCDIIVHTAACQPLKVMPPRAQFEAVNVVGTENLIRALDADHQCRFLLLSTINVHGLPPPPDANADSPLRYSGDRYSDSKVDGERAAWRLAQSRGIALTVIRPACTFGPRGAAWTLQPVDRIRRGTPVLIGGGRGICNPIFVDNLVDLIITAIKSDAAVNESFIGSQGIGVKWRDFFGAYGRMLGLPLGNVPYSSARLIGGISAIYERATGRTGPLSPSSVKFYSHQVTFDVAKNITLLGCPPRIPFEEGMRLTEAWLREEKLIPAI